MFCLAMTFTILGFLLTIGATLLAARAAVRERNMRARRIKDAVYAIKADHEAGDSEMSRYKAVLGETSYTWRDLLLTREYIALDIANDQIREFKLPAVLVGAGVFFSFIGSVLSLMIPGAR